MEFLKKAEIDKGLTNSIRVYLCGNLRDTTQSASIHTDAYELGITEYKEFTFEKPHIHLFNDEYNYVIEGRIKVLLINEKRELTFETGDLFVINPNEPYVCKGIAGTRVIFSKVPGGNDKLLVDADLTVTRWGESWEAQYRAE